MKTLLIGMMLALGACGYETNETTVNGPTVVTVVNQDADPASDPAPDAGVDAPDAGTPDAGTPDAGDASCPVHGRGHDHEHCHHDK